MEFCIADGSAVKFSYVLGDRDLLDRLVTVVHQTSPAWDGRWYVNVYLQGLS